METGIKREPFERAFSSKVKIFYGYKDGRAELKAIAPIGITVPVTFTIDRILKFKEAFDEAYDYDGPEIEREFDPRAKVKYGFSDRRIDIYVRPVPFGPWFSVTVTREEIEEGRPIIKEVYDWTQLPEEVREMQGI